MSALKELVKKIPLLPSLYRGLRNRWSKNTEATFTHIYKDNKWGGADSVSGPGSDTQQTRIIAKELPVLFQDFHVSSVLDVPCGDFHWMRNVDLTNIHYTGADIVKGLIQKNKEQYTKEGICFQRLNLMKDKLPLVDLIFCRDCLVHFSFADIRLALNNVCNSQAEYFLTTTFTDREDNQDIVTGQWRVINLECAPFGLPKPLKIINEGCTEVDGIYTDKSLGLWKIADIRESLNNRPA